MTPLEIIQGLLKLLQKCQYLYKPCGKVATEIAYFGGRTHSFCEEHKHFCLAQTYSAPEKSLILEAERWCRAQGTS